MACFYKPLKTLKDMNNKHTQGEWYYEDDLAIKAKPNKFIAKVAIYRSNSEANAKLIAAAPDLLAALQVLLSLTPTVPTTWNTPFDQLLKDAIITAEEAIKKATK